MYIFLSLSVCAQIACLCGISCAKRRTNECEACGTRRFIKTIRVCVCGMAMITIVAGLSLLFSPGGFKRGSFYFHSLFRSSRMLGVSTFQFTLNPFYLDTTIRMKNGSVSAWFGSSSMPNRVFISVFVCLTV